MHNLSDPILSKTRIVVGTLLRLSKLNLYALPLLLLYLYERGEKGQRRERSLERFGMYHKGVLHPTSIEHVTNRTILASGASLNGTIRAGA